VSSSYCLGRLPHQHRLAGRYLLQNGAYLLAIFGVYQAGAPLLGAFQAAEVVGVVAAQESEP
jgi:hypothetical protein